MCVCVWVCVRTCALKDKAADQAALVQSLAREVQAQMPISAELLQTEFVQPWVDNDPQVHLEICSCLATKDTDFTTESLSVFRGSWILTVAHRPFPSLTR